jgi:hypothetical protein
MIWKDYDSSLHLWMLKLTERFDLTFSVPEESDKFNIVPCLLSETKPKNVSFCRNIVVFLCVQEN